jgi:hypothetical protein
MKPSFARGSLLARLAALAVVVGVVSLTLSGASAAPPPGTIYYRNGYNSFRGMKSDGTGSTEVLPSAPMQALTPGWVPIAVPSNHRHSGDRWWIAMAHTGTYDHVVSGGGASSNYKHYDLFAVRRSSQNSSALDIVQLTDLFGVVWLAPQSGSWSNDSNVGPTSFADAWGYDCRNTFVENDDGSTSLDLRDIRVTPVVRLRLPITASEIDAGWLGNDFIPYNASLTDAELDDLLWPYVSPTYNMRGLYSPDGSLHVVTNQNRLVLLDAAAPDVSNPVRVLWNSNVGAPQSISRYQWSPDGLTIALTTDDGDVWTQPASGASPPRKVHARYLKGSTTRRYSQLCWSPDSQFLVAFRDEYSGTTKVSSRLFRLPAGGGTPFDLGAVNVNGSLLRWVSDN